MSMHLPAAVSALRPLGPWQEHTCDVLVYKWAFDLRVMEPMLRTCLVDALPKVYKGLSPQVDEIIPWVPYHISIFSCNY